MRNEKWVVFAGSLTFDGGMFDRFLGCRRALVSGVAALLLFMGIRVVEAVDYRVYIGTYTGNGSQGIYAFDFSSDTGEAGPVRLVAHAENPSFLALHPNGQWLYAVNELTTYQGEASGAVSAFRIDSDGILEPLNAVASGGGAPCHLVVDRTGKNVLVANYVGGNTAVLRLASDGSLVGRSALVQHVGNSVNPRRQAGPHAHSVNIDAANRFAVAADLGVDKVFVYPFDAESGTLDVGGTSSVSLKPGAGPRHFSFHPNGRLAVSNGELHSTVTSFRYDSAKGTLTVVDTESTLPSYYTGGNSTAEARVHPSGRFVYVSNRGHNSIAAFSIDPASGELSSIEQESTQGKTPRNFGLEPQGDYLLAANQGSDSVVVFHIDGETGALAPNGTTVAVPTPVCVTFVPKN